MLGLVNLNGTWDLGPHVNQTYEFKYTLNNVKYKMKRLAYNLGDAIVYLPLLVPPPVGHGKSYS